MNYVKDLLVLKCRANYFRVVFWKNGTEQVAETEILSHFQVYNDYNDYELLSFDVAPELAEKPTYFMGEEMRLMVRPVITLNVEAQGE